MAYYLASDGVDDYVQLNTPVNIPASTPYRVEIDFQAVDGADFGVRLSGNIGANTNRTIVFKGNAPNAIGPVAAIATTSGINILNRAKWAWYRTDAITNRLSVSDVVMPTTNANSSNASFSVLLTELSVTNSRNPVNLYSYKVFVNDVLIHHWNPSASNGTGNQLLDVVGGNHGTLVNFNGPTNSHWVFYDDGGGINAEVDLAKSSVSLIAKVVQSVSDSNVNFSKSTVQLFGKSLSVESSANAELIKSLIQINNKSIVGVADGSVSFSKSVVNVVAKQIEASTSSAVNAEADLLKSSVSIVGKSSNVSADANINLSKSLVSLIGKQLGLTNDAIVSLSKSNVQLIGKLLVGDTSAAVDAVVDLIKGTVTLTSKDLTASVGAEANLTKSVVTLTAKQLSIASDANADLLKGVVQLTGKFLSVGDIAYSIPTDRIFFIPVNSVVFNIDANNYVFDIPVNQHTFKINEGN